MKAIGRIGVDKGCLPSLFSLLTNLSSTNTRPNAKLDLPFTMAPKAKDNVRPVAYDEGETKAFNADKTIGNNDLIPNAGKVILSPAQPYGRGLINDVKSTLGTWWVKVSTNTRQRLELNTGH
jgi:hypothetical protein